MNRRLICLIGGISAVIGVTMIIISFNINPGPPDNPTMEQLMAFGDKYYRSILWGAWLQAIGPFLIILFALTIVSLADATRSLSGMMTTFGASVLMTVSLIEITFYISALFKGPGMTSLISMNVIYSVQHLYFIIGAPAIFLPLGVVIIFSKILSKLFGWLAIVLGVIFGLLGVLFLFRLVLPIWVTACAGVQAFWWLSAGISLALRSKLLSTSDIHI